MSTSNMPARIWADLNSPAWSRSLDAVSGFDSAMPYYRADIVEAMAEALKEARDALNGAPNTIGLHSQIDSAINSYREASNVES